MGHVKTMFAIAFILGGCASPSIQYLGVEPHHVAVGGMDFKIYQIGENLQVIRVNAGRPPGRSEFRILVMRAIEQATGCEVDRDSLEGDFNLVNGVVEC
ncbi:MAG: hypothetical protein L3J33_11815 [Rhodobacteraceae bacterium]|nr:hypothetical protein [Paracoccaceae bacterium]